MARTVKVGLDVDEKPYTQGVDRATKATEKLDDALDDVTGSAKDTTAAVGGAKESTEDLGGSAKDAGRDLTRLRDDAAKLDRQIDETSRSIRDLAREIARTSDEAARADLNKKLNVEQGKLREKVTLRKLIDVDSAGDMGAELAQKASLSFAAKFGPLLARAPMAGMNPAALAIGAPLVAGVVTLLGTAAAGAIIGGVGIGGVIGGLKLAAQDPAVKAAGTELSDDLSAMFGRASAVFVPETLGALDTIRTRVLGMEGDFARVLSAASHYVDPLVDGLFDAADNAMPGLIDAVEAAGPVINVVADGARDLGEAIGDGLSDLAPYADEGARALQILFAVMTGGVEATFKLVEGMAALYSVAEIVGAVMSGNVPKAIALIAAQDGTKTSTGGLSEGLRDLIDKLRNTGTETKTAEQRTKDLKTAFDELFNEDMGYDRALIAYKDGVKDLNKELTEGKRTLDTNSQAGRDNATAVLDQIGKIKELRDARIEQGESIDTVNGKYDTEIGKIRAKLEKLGYEKSEIDALIGKYEKIPDRVVTKVEADTRPAIDSVKSIVARINNMSARINVYAEPHGSFGGGAHTGFGYSTGERWGGIYEHAQAGLVNLREAGVYSPVSPARYAFAEPATGGEAFIPRYGNEARSLGILSRAAQWYGQQVVPAGMGGGGMASAPPEVRVFIGDQELRGMVRVEVAGHNRDLRRRVGAGAGRV